MKLVTLTALLAVCGAAKLDRTYLPPTSAATAGGSPDFLQTPFSRSSTDQEKISDSLPTGSYTNDFQGVVVDADAAGIRTSADNEQSGLGRPRESYGSENSKVGEAAFRGTVGGFHTKPTFGSSGLGGPVSGNNAGQFGTFESKSERPQAFKDRNSNIITYANDVSADTYSYGFESDNGIAVGENGVDNNGIQAQGGYSYKGDDGQVYKVTYVADEGGYRPQGDHLPTPPPIPKEILESLEQNAKDEAAGLVDDGSYDAQKYNAEGDYTHHNGGNTQYNSAQLSQFAKRPESDATTSNTFINQNSQTFSKPGQFGNIGVQNIHSQLNGQANHFGSENNQGGSQNKPSSQIISEHQQSLSTGIHSSGYYGQNSGSQLQFGQTQGALGSQSAQFPSQNNQQAINSQLETTQFGSQVSQHGSSNQFGGQAHQVGSAPQFGSLPDKPSFGSNFVYNSQSNEGSQFANQAFKPQSSLASSAQAQNSFGQSSYYNNNKQGDSQVLQTQFGNAGLNKPTFGSFASNKPSTIGQSQGQTINNNGNRFPNTPNQFGAEYSPPIKSNDRPSYNNPQTNKVSTSNDSDKNSQSIDFIPLGGHHQSLLQGSSASAFPSVGPTVFQNQSTKPSSAFQTQSLRPNQSNYQLTSHGQTLSNTLTTSSQHTGSHAIPALAFGSKPTSIPETELTTPFESNGKPAFPQGSHSNSQSEPSLGNFGSQFLNNQAQPQVGFQNNVAATSNQYSTDQTSFSTGFRPQGSTQFDSTSPAPILPDQQVLNSNEQNQQLPQNTFTQNQQNNANQNYQNNAYYSTQKPSFGQGTDDSYYYNQPSKPFGISSSRPQGSGFPNTPSYQSNGVASNLFSQQGVVTSPTKIPSSSSLASASPIPTSQFTQNQGSPSNYYNGITQASISSFPSVSPTASTQYDTTQGEKFESKPSLTQSSVSQPQFNRPIITQQQSSGPSFPSKPGTIFEQNPSSSSTQDQILLGQSLLNNNNLPSAAPSFPSKPINSQISSNSFTQNQMQFGQSSPSNDTQIQEYQGTIYEYNKPAPVFPVPEQTDSSSSQSVQSNLSSKPQKGQEPNTQPSKPQFGSQQTQFSQSTFSPQNQQSILNQPQYNSQAFKPFGTSSLNTINTQFGQNSQSMLQHSVQPGKPNESTLLATSQFDQNLPTNSGLRPQFSSQPARPLGSVPSLSQFGQSFEQPQDATNFTSTHQKGSQSGVQPLKPFDSAQSNTQFGPNMQTNFGSVSSQENPGSQLATQSNKPFASASSSLQFGQAAQSQNSHTTSFASTQHNNAQNTQIGTQPIKPIGTTGTAHNFQGYSSSKPQFDTQFPQNHFTQGSQQTFGTTPINSQPAREPQISPLSAKPFGNTPSIHGSPDSQKPQFGSTQFTQGLQPSGTYSGQQPFQSNQFGSSALKPQFGTQTQIIQNQNPNKPLFTQNTAQVSSSAVTQQQPQGEQAYKPFGASSTQGLSFQSQNKPQLEQLPQSSLGASTTSLPSLLGVQSLKPFDSLGIPGSQSKPQTAQNKPFASQQGSSCCQDSKGSSITTLNVGKPSQAFAQTQSQFTGFHGVQSVAGKGEEFGGPRQPPSFDTQTGYHY